ncbi:MAG: hypothetical protein HZB99_02405 [Candidatus Harrisonbacteria bacterium]|nr:hypothetical protein [Candidatus Harrisonbacteria bacterium]
MSKRNINMVIGLDLDGVLVDHTDLKIRLAKRLGFNLLPKDTPTEVMNKILPEGRWRELQHLLYSDPKLSLLSPLMRGAKSMLNNFQKNKIDYLLISRRKSTVQALKLLEKRGLWPEYFNDKNTFFVVEPEDKNIKAAEFGVTHYIDDERRVLEKLADVRHRFLFDRHRVFPETDFYKKIHSWPEFYEYLS